MSKKLKFITVSVLTMALIFGGTLNFSEAASKSTTKIINELKKEIKKLTASNTTKDKEIAKLKEDAKKKDNEIANLKSLVKGKDKEIARWVKDYRRLNGDLIASQSKVWDLRNHYRRSLYPTIF